MSRARNIKPGFFANEELVELPFETRLLFIGLWIIADREGRLEDRPKRIKMAVFPADSVDIEKGLDALQSSGFIRRYTAKGIACIQVINFKKHQNPHIREAPSSLPEEEDEHQASTVPAPDKHQASHADSLIPYITPQTPLTGGFPVDKSTEETPAGRRKAVNKSHRLNLATDKAVATAWREHFGKNPPAGKSLEECRTLFWQQYRGAH